MHTRVALLLIALILIFSTPLEVHSAPVETPTLRPALTASYGFPAITTTTLPGESLSALAPTQPVFKEFPIGYPSADYGEYPSLAIIPNTSHPYIAFWDAANDKIAVWEGGNVFYTVDSGWETLPYPALASDADGRPHVAWSTSLGGVYYAYRDWASGEFVRSFVGSGVDPQVPVSLALDPQGRAHIAYYSHVGSERQLIYARYAGGYGFYEKFAREAIESSTSYAVGYGPSIAVDSAGFPHVTYYDYGSGYLMYKEKTALGWQPAEQVEYLGTYEIDNRTSLALDGGGTPHIVYWRVNTGGLRYCTWGSASFSWECQTLDSDPGAGRYHDLAIDQGNQPHISYHLAKTSGGLADGDLLYIYRESGSWHKYTLDSQGDTGIDTSIAIDDSGNTHIAYYDDSRRLHYIYEAPPVTGLLGDVGCAWGEPYCNACASNVVETFNSLRSHGDILSFYVDPDVDPTRNPSNFFFFEFGDAFHHHWQGVQRLMADGEPYLVTTLDGEWTYFNYGAFSIANLASRDADGLRFRANRIWRDFGWLSGSHTVPPDGDEVVHSEIISYANGRLHPGGIQMIGDLLVIPYTDGGVKDFDFYDLQEPTSPAYITSVDLRSDTGFSTAAVQRLDNGDFLLASYSDAGSLDFFRGEGTPWLITADTSWSMIDSLKVPDEIPTYYSSDWDSFQSLNFVSDCASGKLYLVATGNDDDSSSICPRQVFPFIDAPCYPDGIDSAVLYEVTLDSSSNVSVQPVADHLFFCGEDGSGTDHCNFDAAAGIYVDPNHQMILYSTEHASDGYNDSVKFKEFRPVPHGSCYTVQDGWLELGKDPRPDWDYSLMIDNRDYYEGKYENLDDFNFEDKARSASWCVPEGYSYYLYEDKNPCEGQMTKLSGTGRFQQATLSTLVGKKKGKTSCVRLALDTLMIYGYNPTVGHQWVYVLDLLPDFSLQTGAETTSTQLQAQHAAAAADSNRTISVNVPAGAIDETLDLTFKSLSPPTHETGEWIATSYGFNLGYEGEQLPEGFTTQLEVLVNIQYDQADMDGLDEDSLFPFYWDTGLDGWTPAHETCPGAAWPVQDTQANVISFSICKFGEYALLGANEPLRILVDELHDNRMTLDYARAQVIAGEEGPGAQPEWYYLDALANAGGNDYRLEAATSGAMTDALLEAYDVLLIPHYRAEMSAEEVSAVQRFVARGGGLVLSGDCGFGSPNPELGAAYGVTFAPECLFAPIPDYNGELDIPIHAQHSALTGVERVTFNWSQSLQLSGSAVTMLNTDSNTWMDADFSGDFNGEVDPGGEFVVAATYDTGCGRVASLGDNTFSDADLSWTENEDLMRGLFLWVGSGSPCEVPEAQIPARVLVDEAHNNQLSLDWARAGSLASEWGPGAGPEEFYLGALVDALSGAFSFERNTAPLTADMLDNYDALLIPYYKQALDETEVQAVQAFVAQGGGLILLGDAGYVPPNPDLAAEYGIAFSPYPVFIGDSGLVGAFEVPLVSEHPAIDGRQTFIEDWGQSLSLSGEAVPLFSTAFYDAWHDVNYSDGRDSGEEGVFQLAAAADTGCGRVIAIGDSAFTDYALDWTNNQILFRSMLNWISDARACLRAVLVDEAHDNRLTLDWRRAEQIVADQGWGNPTYYVLNTFSERLDDEITLLPNRDQPLTLEYLSNFDALLIPLYSQPFTADEVQAVKDYVRQGGGVLFLADAAYDDPNPELTAAFGFEYANNILFAPQPQANPEFSITNFANHPAVSQLRSDGAVYWMGWGASLNLTGANTTWLADTGGQNAWRDMDWDDVYTPGIDQTGDFTVAAAYDAGCGRVVVLADEFFGDDPLYATQNQEFVRQAVSWITSGSACALNGEMYIPMVLR